MPDIPVDQIREQMARIRKRAHRKASRLGEETRQFLNWQHYVRLFPWRTIAAAAVVGYLIVPSRQRRAAPQFVADLARDGRMLVAPAEAQAPKKAGLLGAAAGFLGTLALRAATSYAQSQAMRLLTQWEQSPGSSQEQEHEPSQPYT